MTTRSKRKAFLTACLLVAASSLGSLLVGEAFVRLIRDPVDYLLVDLAEDDVLGHKVAPGSGHDAWGFRNKAVPASAGIVAIGDSQTYGTASARNSWPAKLEKLLGEPVYNLSLGGYGPGQYYHLLKTKALELNPHLIVVGFYFGNDLLNSYGLIYRKEYWSHLRKAGFVIEDEMVVSDTRRGRLVGSLRNWLSHHSVLYRMFTIAFGDIFRFFELKYRSSRGDVDISILEDDEKIRTGFTPGLRLRALDLTDSKVQEGLRLTLELFRQMKHLCDREVIGLLIVLIPTKESVFADIIEGNNKIANFDLIDQLIRNEREVNRLIKNYFVEQRISYVDVLPDLRSTLSHKLPYPTNQDGHPNALGYEIIAKAIERFLREFMPPRQLPLSN
jgi:lysophospholipase L1-like esterase